MRDARAELLNSVIAQLEKGVRPWQPSWKAGNMAGPVSRPLRHNSIPYNGINVIALWMTATAAAKGYSSPFWMTYKSGLELGGHVRKGERSATVFYANTFNKVAENENGEQEEKKIPYLKAYSVFNAEQFDGIPAHFTAEVPRQTPDFQRIEAAETFMDNLGIETRHGGSRAFYNHASDFIQMPVRESFNDAVAYYGTRLHECVHATGHKDRLARELGKRFGDQAYGQEELVAELGCIFAAADLGIEPEPREDHVSYLSAWLALLKKDKGALFIAASAAQKAVDWMHGRQPKAP